MNWQNRIYESLTEVKGPAEHGAEVFQKKLGNAGAGESERAQAAVDDSDKAKKRRARRLRAVKFGKGQRIFGKTKDFNPGTKP
tara:strand:- start:4023 stop:4271 length:249 start_codon:yes stop_codon:yes gene_type:complete